jgi:Domain of unknown function (DUF4351)
MNSKKVRQQNICDMTLRVLVQRIGDMAPDLQTQVKALSPAQIDALGDALLGFSEPSDLVKWLAGNCSG